MANKTRIIRTGEVNDTYIWAAHWGDREYFEITQMQILTLPEGLEPVRIFYDSGVFVGSWEDWVRNILRKAEGVKPISEAASDMGSASGGVKATTARENGKKGGRPRKPQEAE